MFDGKAYGEGIVEIVKGYIEREVAPLKAERESLLERIATLEARPAPEKGEPGDDGKSIEIEDVLPAITAEVERAVAAIPIPKDGEDGKDAAGIVDALKDSGELVLTLADGRLVRTGIRDGENGKDAEPVELDDNLTDEEKSTMAGALLRKELGDAELIRLPDPIHLQAAQATPALVVHNHMPSRGVEKTVVTKHDERGRILEFERRSE